MHIKSKNNCSHRSWTFFLLLAVLSPRVVHGAQVKPISVRIEGTLKNPKSKDEAMKQGGVIFINADDDNFVVDSLENKPDLEEAGPIANENDLQRIKLIVDASKGTSGQVVFKVNAGNKVKVWTKADKSGQALLSSAQLSKSWTLADFKSSPLSSTPAGKSVTTMTLWVEGVARSSSPRDVVFDLTYTRPTTPPTKGVTDQLKYTVVQAFVDVNRDGALTDEISTFWPGRGADRTPVLSIGAKVDRITPQQLQVIVAPVDSAMGVELTVKLNEISKYPGICMNRGHKTDDDFSFSATENKDSSTMQLSANKTIAQLYCKDFAATADFQPVVKRAGYLLTESKKHLPLDSDGDTLPDVFEDAFKTNPINQSVMFDKHKRATSAGKLDPGVDLDGTPVTEGLNTKVTFNPPIGRIGDGFSAFEEYRGFESRDVAVVSISNDVDADDLAASREINLLNPHIKDLFVRAEVHVEPNDFSPAIPSFSPTNLGIGMMTAWQARGLNVWRLTRNQLQIDSRVVNFNRTSGPPQKAVHIKESKDIGAVGMAHGGSITTGDDGVLQTAADSRDTKIIEQFRGQKDSVAVSGGPNGIIDPEYNQADALDAAANRITDGGDGKLDTVTEDYETSGLNRVRGTIRAAGNAPLATATVENMSSLDILRGTITGSAQAPLDPATIASVSGDHVDELKDVVLDFSNGPVPTVSATDTLLPNGIVSPVNPATNENDGFQTERTGNSFFRGTISEGADQVLNARPHGANQVVGSIEPGEDLNLQSRPRATDFVEGYIDGGDPNGPFHGKLHPTLNNADAAIHNANGAMAADDDRWDADNDLILTGDDGILNTSVSDLSDDDPRFETGYGAPHATGIRRHEDRNDIFSVATGDDGTAIAPEIGNPKGINQSPNEHDAVEVNIARMIGANRPGVDLFRDKVTITETSSVFIPSLKETMGHEGSHACHLSHWYQAQGRFETVSKAKNILGTEITLNPPIEVFIPDGNAPAIQFEFFNYFNFEVEDPQNPGTFVPLVYRVDPTRVLSGDAGTAQGKHSGPTIMLSNNLDPVPNEFDVIDQDQLRLHLYPR